MIWKSIGPSGPNYRFVLNLAEGLRMISLGAEKDEHLFSLEEAIKKLDNGSKPNSCLTNFLTNVDTS